MKQASAVAPGSLPPHDTAMLGEEESAHATPRQFARYVPQLGRMSEQLRETSAQMESSVVEVCKSFQEIADQAKATVSRGHGVLNSGRMSDQSYGSFDNLLRRCDDSLRKVLGAIEESGAASRRAIDSISQMDESSDAISKALEELEMIAQGNRMMALNARIEASHAGDKGTGFAVVAVEVAAQTEKAQEVTARVGVVVDRLRELAASTLEDLEEMIARDAARAQQCRQEVDDSLAEMRSAHGAMQNGLAAISQDSEHLAGEIGQAMKGMQFRGGVSDQIARVADDLDALQMRLSVDG